MFCSKEKLINLMRQCDFRPGKRWGQNFLTDRNIRDRIIEAVSLRKTDTVIEIGAGFGALTRELSRKAEKVIAIERDKRLCAILKRSLVNCSNTEIVPADILKFNFTRLSPGSETIRGFSEPETVQDPVRVKVVGNLPYYITTPIIVHLLKAHSFIDFVIITVQKEVAERLLAGPGENSYGAISCFAQFYSRPSLIMKIKKNAFFPQPGIDSSLIKLEILRAPKVRVKDEEFFFKVIRASFNQRRKTLLNSLSNRLKLDKQFLLKVLESAKISSRRRGETLSLEEFTRIANQIPADSR